MKTVEFPIDGAVDAYPPVRSLPAFDPTVLKEQGVDAHVLVEQGDRAVAHASLWWNRVPDLDGERLGVIGHFAAAEDAAAQRLLARLLTRLEAAGCTLAVGPMDGNTWRRYRFVTEPGGEPPFFLEPQNPLAYPGYFLAAGFQPMAEYFSALVSDLSLADPRIPRTRARLQGNGISWRPLDRDRFDDELRRIYRLSVHSFASNFLYTPITEAAFLTQYQAIRPYVRPALTLLAEQGAELLGYLFGIPDLAQAQRGESVDTFIVKTVAVQPGRRSAGLGSVLVAESHRIAAELGYRRAIHALMHEGNQSLNISARYAKTMRRYRLFQRRLGLTG
jgi:GNAT superfamily N-acetyltransferase